MFEAPKLSLVVVQSAAGTLEPTFFDPLLGELEAGRLEIVVVSAGDPKREIVERFGTLTVRCGHGTTVPRMRAAGLAAARAPLVALTESFCVPAPGWVEVMMRVAADVDAVAVGGPVDRRSGRARDWALTFAEYGRFFRRTPPGAVNDLPGINVAYRVDRMCSALGGLPEEIREVDLHRMLRQRGEVLWRAPGAVMFDESRCSFLANTRSQYHHGRLFGGLRANEAAFLRRLLRVALAPLVPIVLAARITREVVSAGRGRALLRACPALGVLLVSWAVGELIGSLLGTGTSGQRWA